MQVRREVCKNSLYAIDREENRTATQRTTISNTPPVTIAQTRPFDVGGVAGSASETVWAGAEVQAGKCWRPRRLLRFPGDQPTKQTNLSRGHSRRRPGRQYLLVSGLCHQHVGHVQAHRAYAGDTAPPGLAINSGAGGALGACMPWP